MTSPAPPRHPDTITTTEEVTMSRPHPANTRTGRHPAAPRTPRRRPASKKSWDLLAVALAAQILVVLDISVVNTALPSIGRSLSLGGGQLAWLVTAYLMMSGGGLLLGGRIADLLRGVPSS